jgi:hypothetical protein
MTHQLDESRGELALTAAAVAAGHAAIAALAAIAATRAPHQAEPSDAS